MEPRIRSTRLIDAARSGLLVIDLQTKLLPAISGAQDVVNRVDQLCRAADLLNVPRWASVQYPQGLGPLDEKLSCHFPDPEHKLDFSAAACQTILQQIIDRGLTQIVVVGIETHICVLQTTLDLLASQFDVFVVSDAVAARRPGDHQTALQRLLAEGATVVSTESVMFEWCQTAANPSFKQISSIVRER